MGIKKFKDKFLGKDQENDRFQIVKLIDFGTAYSVSSAEDRVSEDFSPYQIKPCDSPDLYRKSNISSLSLGEYKSCDSELSTLLYMKSCFLICGFIWVRPKGCLF